MVTSLVVLNLAGGECVEDLRLLEKDEGLGRVLRLAETQGLGRRVSEPSRPAPKAAKTGPSRAPWLDCAQRQPENGPSQRRLPRKTTLRPPCPTPKPRPADPSTLFRWWIWAVRPGLLNC